MQCPKCAGDMWDNRDSKTNPKAPDFKCKDKGCLTNGYQTGAWLEEGEVPPMREPPPLPEDPAEKHDIARFKHAIVDASMLREWAKESHGLDVPIAEVARWATSLFINRS